MTSKLIHVAYEEKDTIRIQGIMRKARGSMRREIILSESMANRILDPAKARRRAAAAEDLGRFTISAIFFSRFVKLERSASSDRVGPKFL